MFGSPQWIAGCLATDPPFGVGPVYPPAPQAPARSHPPSAPFRGGFFAISFATLFPANYLYLQDNYMALSFISFEVRYIATHIDFLAFWNFLPSPACLDFISRSRVRNQILIFWQMLAHRNPPLLFTRAENFSMQAIFFRKPGNINCDRTFWESLIAQLLWCLVIFNLATALH